MWISKLKRPEVKIPGVVQKKLKAGGFLWLVLELEWQ